jgi:hypothetical protein
MAAAKTPKRWRRAAVWSLAFVLLLAGSTWIAVASSGKGDVLDCLNPYKPRRVDLTDDFYCLIVPSGKIDEARAHLTKRLMDEGWVLAPGSRHGERLEYRMGKDVVEFDDSLPGDQIVGTQISMARVISGSPVVAEAKAGELMIMVSRESTWFSRQVRVVRRWLGK